MKNYKVYHNNKLKAEFINQETDLMPFKFILTNQSNSIDRALKYEGWKVEEIDCKTKKIEYWKPYC